MYYYYYYCSKLHFHAQLDYIFSQSIRMLSFIQTIAYSFSTLDNLLLLYLTVNSPKLQYASAVWNCAQFADVKELESVLRNLVALRQYRFFSHDHATYEDYPKILKLHTLYDSRLHLDALLFISVPSCLNCCPSPLDITGIPVLPHNFRTPSPLIT